MCGLSQGYAVCCRWLLMGLLITGLVFSGMTVASCHFLEFVNGNGEQGAVGLYRVWTTTGECVDHPDSLEYNELVKAARMGGVVAPMAACFTLVLLLLEFCCCRFMCSRLVMGMALLTAQVMQGITFLLFDSEQFCNGDILTELLHQVPCTVGDGSIWSILAIVMYFMSGVLIFCTPKPVPMWGKKTDVECGTSSRHSTRSMSSNSASWRHDDIETPIESSKSATFT